jgi:hypothetical protein
MVSMNERYPRTGFLTAADVRDGDLILQIGRVDLDRDFGAAKARKDVVVFRNDGRELVLNGPNARQIEKLHGDSDDWPGKWISLFLDKTVENPRTGEKGGVRVGPTVPAVAGNGSEAIAPSAPTSASRVEMDDEIPF